jgi:hypothetical protein
METLVAGLLERVEEAERRREAMAAEVDALTSQLQGQAEAADTERRRAADAIETVMAGLVERAEAAEAAAAAAATAAAEASAAAPASTTAPVEAEDPLGQRHWAEELDTIVKLEELLRASEGTVKFLQHGVSETVASLKQQEPGKKKAAPAPLGARAPPLRKA